MKRRLLLEFRECMKCPYCRLTKRIEDSRGDLWMCYHDPLDIKEIIEDKAVREFVVQYPNMFPSWCPLPQIEDDEQEVEKKHDVMDGRKFKWSLQNAAAFDMARAVIYMADDGKHWRLYAARQANNRATNSSYEDYDSFEKVIERFEQDHGGGAKWTQEPLKVSARKRIF